MGYWKLASRCATALLAVAMGWPAADACGNEEPPSAWARLKQLESQRDALAGQRDKAQSRLNLRAYHGMSADDLKAAADRQKREYEQSRDQYRAAAESALDVQLNAAFRAAIADDRKAGNSKLKKRSESRQEMVRANQRKMADNEEVMKLLRNRLQDGQVAASRESYKSAYEQAKASFERNPTEANKSRMEFHQRQYEAQAAPHQQAQRQYDQLERENRAMAQRNAAADKVIRVIEGHTKSFGAPYDQAQQQYDAGRRNADESMEMNALKFLADLKDACLQERDVWSTNLADWEKDNDWARRVAAEIFLGMDQAVLESANPELTLIYSHPELKRKFMQERADMFEQMAAGVDQSLQRLLNVMQEAATLTPAEEEQLEAFLKELNTRLADNHRKCTAVRAEIVVADLPKGMVNEDVLDRWLRGTSHIAGFECSDDLRRAIVEQFLRVRQHRLNEVAALFDDLRQLDLMLACLPASPVPWLPQEGKMTITVELQDRGFREKIDRLKVLARQLTALALEVTVADDWTFKDKVHSTRWPETRERVFSFDQPDSQVVQVARRVNMQINRPPRHSCPDAMVGALTKSFEKNATLTVEFTQPTFPGDLAGRWTGTFVIRDMPLLAAIKAEQQKSRQPGAWQRPETDDPIGQILGEAGEGCAIPPELFNQVVEKMEKLQDRDIPITFDVEPHGPHKGRITMLATPPADLGMGAGQPKTLPYNYTQGVITFGGLEKNMETTLRGTLQPATPGWTIRGTWQSHVSYKGQKIPAMQGTWSGTNPNAK